MSTELDAYLQPYRRDVLFVFRYAVLLCLAAYLFIGLIPLGLDAAGPASYVTLAICLGYSIVAFIIRERHIELQAVLSTVTFLVMSVLLQFQHGPTYGAGVLALMWVAWYVFFHNNIFIPLVLHVLSATCIVLLEHYGFAPGWGAGEFTMADWLRTFVVPFFPLVGGAYLIQQLLSGVIKSLLLESEARKRELDIQREKEIIDKALTQRYRLESIGRLASGVAHDFNNVLTVLMSCLEVLKVVKDGPTRDGIVKDMEAAVKSAEMTSRKLLSLSTSGSAASEPADPRTSLRTLVANLKRLFPENIIIEEYVRGTPRVAVQAGDFEQAILNLCINARDSMPEGGILTLECYEEPQDQMVIVEVGDTGTGMSEEILAKAIDPFFSTKVERDGTGLGLSQVYGAIQAVGGDLRIESGVDLGTRVRLFLPVAEPAVNQEPSSEDKPKSGFEPGPGEKNVLLLDDDKLVAATMSRALVSAGYSVTAANSVSEAISHLNKQEYQLLITDRGLPDGSPSSVVSKFRKISGGPVLLISGYETDDPLGEGVEFLQKPFTPATLLSRLDELTHSAGACE